MSQNSDYVEAGATRAAAGAAGVGVEGITGPGAGAEEGGTAAGNRPPGPFGVAGVGYFRISTLTALTALIRRSNLAELRSAQKASAAATAS